VDNKNSDDKHLASGERAGSRQQALKQGIEAQVKPMGSLGQTHISPFVF